MNKVELQSQVYLFQNNISGKTLDGDQETERGVGCWIPLCSIQKLGSDSD